MSNRGSFTRGTLVCAAFVVSATSACIETKQPLLVASSSFSSPLLVLYSDGELIHRDRNEEPGYFHPSPVPWDKSWPRPRLGDPRRA